jgi:oligoribonuclease (3'-5' exoribonuclease)
MNKKSINKNVKSEIRVDKNVINEILAKKVTINFIEENIKAIKNKKKENTLKINAINKKSIHNNMKMLESVEKSLINKISAEKVTINFIKRNIDSIKKISHDRNATKENRKYENKRKI